MFSDGDILTYRGIRMRILAHRGWWTTRAEKNSRLSFQRAFVAGYGVETDIRDCAGELVISHDMPLGRLVDTNYFPLDEFLDLYVSYSYGAMLALNIKSDGLVNALRQALTARSIDNYFVFDMSVPDMLGYLKAKMCVFSRRSEFESGSILDLRANGYWLDAFDEPFVPVELVKMIVRDNKPFTLVSPELHGKPHISAWSAWRELYVAAPVSLRRHFHICSDLPDEAEAFFRAPDAPTRGDN